ncbi:MAG TPA: choice-of-anchor J domain-containing protein [Pyrinomonadaceae bacterium]|nr:choice-of-anchor J domain-containing protein [Pyrinomonadaceae bacterium]
MSLTPKVESLSSMILKGCVISLAIIGLWFANVSIANAQAINEDFASVAGLPAAGWASSNQSTPLGASVWSQCSGTAIPPAQAGASTSCILVNFNSTTGVGTISNWLIAPNRTFNNGDTISFYTKTPSTAFPDRLQVRLSTNGASTNVGTGATQVGDFTNLLLDINPTYGTDYPVTWTQFTVTISGLAGPTSGRIAFRYFVEDAGPDGANSNIIGIDTFVYTPFTAPPAGSADFDYTGDGKADVSVFRPSAGSWYLSNSATSAFSATPFGNATDVIVPADYDGDNKTDIAVFRDGNWYRLNSSNGTFVATPFGQAGDIPVPGDFDGDNKADTAVYRAGNWYRLNSSNGAFVATPFGNATDKPQMGDFDGDNKADIAVFRPSDGTWYRLNSSNGALAVVTFGNSTDIPVPADYDGDAKTDIAVYRGGNWYRLNSSNGAFVATAFGNATDTPVPADYDGDAKADVAVFRPSDGSWYRLNSSNGAFAAQAFGTSTDKPTESAYIR